MTKISLKNQIIKHMFTEHKIVTMIGTQNLKILSVTKIEEVGKVEFYLIIKQLVKTRLVLKRLVRI